jgi:hypothetical protein
VVRGAVHLAGDVGGVLLDGFDYPTCEVVQFISCPRPTAYPRLTCPRARPPWCT